MADAATRLLALQNEREYLLFKMRDLQAQQGDGLHPTGEQRTLMIFFEQLNAKIRDLVDEVMAEDEPGFVVNGEEIHELVRGTLTDGLLIKPDGGEETTYPGEHKVVVLFLK